MKTRSTEAQIDRIDLTLDTLSAAYMTDLVTLHRLASPLLSGGDDRLPLHLSPGQDPCDALHARGVHGSADSVKRSYTMARLFNGTTVHEHGCVCVCYTFRVLDIL